MQIYCGVCRGYVDHRWHPRCPSTVKQGIPVTVELLDDSDQEQKLNTVVEVVRVRNNSMTPIPHANTDDSDGTESEDEREIASFCGQCNAQVPIQMKENGSCHGKFFSVRKTKHTWYFQE